MSFSTETNQSTQVSLFYWAGIPEHIALRTYLRKGEGSGHYISYWTDNCPLHKNYSKGHLHSEEEDKKIFRTKNNENSLPTLAYDLYTLKVEEINKAYEKFKESSLSWKTFGNWTWIFESHDAASLVYSLLNKGNITHLAVYSGKTPDYFGEKNFVSVSSSTYIGMFTAVLAKYWGLKAEPTTQLYERSLNLSSGIISMIDIFSSGSKTILEGSTQLDTISENDKNKDKVLTGDNIQDISRKDYLLNLGFDKGRQNASGATRSLLKAVSRMFLSPIAGLIALDGCLKELLPMAVESHEKFHLKRTIGLGLTAVSMLICVKEIFNRMADSSAPFGVALMVRAAQEKENANKLSEDQSKTALPFYTRYVSWMRTIVGISCFAIGFLGTRKYLLKE